MQKLPVRLLCGPCEAEYRSWSALLGDAFPMWLHTVDARQRSGHSETNLSFLSQIGPNPVQADAKLPVLHDGNSASHKGVLNHP